MSTSTIRLYQAAPAFPYPPPDHRVAASTTICSVLTMAAATTYRTPWVQLAPPDHLPSQFERLKRVALRPKV
jgi:hypothetical protein